MDGFRRVNKNSTSCKNYQIDAMKLFFAICVFLYHARIFAPNGSIIRDISNKFGWFSVHFFFVISGLFMAAHYFREKEYDKGSCGRQSMCYVMSKIKSIAPLYFTTFAVDFIVYYVLAVYNNKGTNALITFIHLAAKAIPELFTLQMFGVRPIGVNSITWYLSAMFIAMLPMYYIMKKKPDFFFYILSPILAMSLFAFFYNSGEPFYDQNNFVFIFTGGFLRAVCGISFGVLSYLMSDFIKSHCSEKSLLITAVEILFSFFFLVIWFIRTLDASILFPTSMLFPIILAIVYSERSYVSVIFRSSVFRYLGTWSMWLYMNHYAARKIISETGLMNISDYRVKYIYMAAITLLSCVLCYCIMYIFKISYRKIYTKKIIDNKNNSE